MRVWGFRFWCWGSGFGVEGLGTGGPTNKHLSARSPPTTTFLVLMDFRVRLVQELQY